MVMFLMHRLSELIKIMLIVNPETYSSIALVSAAERWSWKRFNMTSLQLHYELHGKDIIIIFHINRSFILTRGLIHSLTMTKSFI